MIRVREYRRACCVPDDRTTIGYAKVARLWIHLRENHGPRKPDINRTLVLNSKVNPPRVAMKPTDLTMYNVDKGIIAEHALAEGGRYTLK